MKKIWKKPRVIKVPIGKVTLSGSTGPSEMSTGNNEGKYGSYSS